MNALSSSASARFPAQGAFDLLLMCPLVFHALAALAAEPNASTWPLLAGNETVKQYAERVGLPETTTLEISDGVKLETVLIAAGKFMMGSPATENGRNVDEQQHGVTITRPFYMGKYLVTQEQYAAVMQANPSHYKGLRNPVEEVLWNQASEFCKKATEKCHVAIRLPTEAEWEYACRAGTTTPFSTGETLSTDQANYNGTHIYGDGVPGQDREKPTPVGLFPPNRWGLYDMHGNVGELCQDWYDRNYYASSPAIDPPGPAEGRSHVARGGSWWQCPVNCRSASRLIGGATASTKVGFRVVVEVSATMRKKE